MPLTWATSFQGPSIEAKVEGIRVTRSRSRDSAIRWPRTGGESPRWPSQTGDRSKLSRACGGVQVNAHDAGQAGREVMGADQLAADGGGRDREVAGVAPLDDQRHAVAALKHLPLVAAQARA